VCERCEGCESWEEVDEVVEELLLLVGDADEQDCSPIKLLIENLHSLCVFAFVVVVVVVVVFVFVVVDFVVRLNKRFKLSQTSLQFSIGK
jgi:hypothetical protein